MPELRSEKSKLRSREGGKDSANFLALTFEFSLQAAFFGLLAVRSLPSLKCGSRKTRSQSDCVLLSRAMESALYRDAKFSDPAPLSNATGYSGYLQSQLSPDAFARHS